MLHGIHRPRSLHWHKGLFVQPQHLQVLQRNVGQGLALQRAYQFAYPWGLVRALVDQDALRGGVLAFDHLVAVMPSGLELAYPDNADLPPLQLQGVAAGGGSAVVYLEVPLWKRNEPNMIASATGDGGGALSGVLYRDEKENCPDENTGRDPQWIQLRRINARLTTEARARDGWERMAVAKIVRRGQGRALEPELDGQFIPPCMLIGGSATLREQFIGLASRVMAGRKAVVKQLKPGFDRDTLPVAKVQQMMRLQTLNRFAARLNALASADNLPPFAVYLELRDLHAELTALSPVDDPFTVKGSDHDRHAAPAYNHEEPSLWFYDLANAVAAHLEGDARDRFVKVEFAGQNPLALRAAVSADIISKCAGSWYLGVASRHEADRVRDWCEDNQRFRLLPDERIGAAAGVPVVYLPHRPAPFANEANIHFFRIEDGKDPNRWNMIMREGKMVILQEANSPLFDGTSIALYRELKS